jgi:hypothetical protein
MASGPTAARPRWPITCGALGAVARSGAAPSALRYPLIPQHPLPKNTAPALASRKPDAQRHRTRLRSDVGVDAGESAVRDRDSGDRGPLAPVISRGASNVLERAPALPRGHRLH